MFLKKPALRFWKNWIKVKIHLVIHTLFICFTYCLKDGNWLIVVNICFIFLLWTDITFAFFRSFGNLNMNNRLLKLAQLKWKKRSLFSLISISGISFSWFVLPRFPIYLDTSVCYYIQNKTNSYFARCNF